VKRLRFLWRITERFLRGHRANFEDIAGDYDQASGTYDETWQSFMAPVSLGFLARWEPPPQGSVLDLGCGTGAVLDHLRRRGFEGRYCGVDISAGMMARLPLGPGVELHQGDAHGWIEDVPDQTFDAVSALWSWEYMDRRRMLPHIRRVLRPGGMVVLLANRRNTVPELEGAFLRLMARQPGEIQKVFHRALGMPRSGASLVREVLQAGFQVCHRVEDERVQAHATAAEAVSWGFQTGVLAGTRCVLELPDLESRLAEMLEDSQPESQPFSTTHRYAGVLGVLPC